METKIYNPPVDVWRPSRRGLLRTFVSSAIASGLGAVAARAQRPAASRISWNAVKEQFPMADELVLMNAANLCPPPLVVRDVLEKLTEAMDADASFQSRDQFSELTEASRRAVAGFLGAEPDEIALVRNTSEANNTVVNGIDLRPGDEVLLWDQNHPTNNTAWDVRARRFGFTVKRVSTPAHPRSPEDLITPFRSALAPATKVLSFSHASNISGISLPAAALCRLARDRGILTLIDGAQTCGSFVVNLQEIGCDFYTASAHKWLTGPKEVGVLFVRKETIPRLWPNVVGAGWESVEKRGARKFESLGQRDDPAVAAVAEAVRFHERLGKERVEKRIFELASLLKTEIAKLPGAKVLTPLEPELSSGVVIFNLEGVETKKGFESLYRNHRVAGAAMSGLVTGIRLCPHIYNDEGQVERVLRSLRQLSV